MPKYSGVGWALRYVVAGPWTRLLISLPRPMLEDLHTVSSAQGVSVAEFVRLAVCERVVASGVSSVLGTSCPEDKSS